jgi:nucleoside-diphosphate-sugar epimerase
MATYLVTGGAGFIGSHLAEALVARGHEVRILDDFSTGKRENIAPFSSKVRVVVGDIRDRSVVTDATKGVDYVLHEAALPSVPRSIEDPCGSNAVNVDGTLNVLEAARQHGVKRVVYASSSSVYGDEATLPKSEDMHTSPKSPYAVGKLTGEWYCRIYNDIYGLRTVSLRYFNVFGPRQDPDSQYSAVIPIFLSALMHGKRPTIFGDGEHSRDFTYVENVVSANLAACESERAAGGVYNVACGRRFTLNLLYESLKTILGVDIDPIYDDPRPGDVKHSEAAITAIQRDMNYEPSVGFEEGLRRTIAWFKEKA